MCLAHQWELFMYLYFCNCSHNHSTHYIQLTLHKSFRNKANKKVSCKTYTNVVMVQRVIKNRVHARTHHTGKMSRYKEGVSCNPQPLQVTFHHLQETLHTLYLGQHSQASRHFEAIVTIPTSGNIFLRPLFQ